MCSMQNDVRGDKEIDGKGKHESRTNTAVLTTEADLLSIKNHLWNCGKACSGKFPSPWNRHRRLASWTLTSSGPTHSKAVKCNSLWFTLELLPGVSSRAWHPERNTPMKFWSYRLHLHKSKSLVLSTLQCLGSSRLLTTCAAVHKQSQLLSSESYFMPGSSSLYFFILQRKIITFLRKGH